MACGEGCQIIEFELKKGSVIPIHDHVNEQVGAVIKGRLLLRLGNEEREVKAGDGYAIAPRMPHGAKALEDTMVIDVFAPPRQDYCDSTGIGKK